MKEKRFKISNNWLHFWFGWNFRISYQICEYFDARHHINLSLGFFHLQIALPFKSKHTDECVPPEWGIAIHNNMFWIYKGGKGNMNGGNKTWSLSFPWEYDWVRSSSLRKDGTWEHETEKERKSFWEDKWKEVLWAETYPFTYVLKSGKIQERQATVKVEEREWRQRWLKWTSLFAKVRKDIAVDFNNEVGERAGSWIGGITGCSLKMNHGELPEQALRRMEKTVKFN